VGKSCRPSKVGAAAVRSPVTFFTKDILAPARRPNETYANYCSRRRRVNQAIKGYLGHLQQLVHQSNRIIRIPEAGEDERIDEAVRRGELRPVAAGLDRGKRFRVALTKGITFRKGVR